MRDLTYPAPEQRSKVDRRSGTVRGLARLTGVGSPKDGRGEEWNASSEWKQALIDDVLARWIPAGAVVLEIGPGAGRWSEFLVERGSGLVLVDVSERPLKLCRERFKNDARIRYILSSGSDLPGVEDGSIDAVWSFDVFVHVSPCDQAAYLQEIARVLAPGGIAVVHHATARLERRGALLSGPDTRARHRFRPWYGSRPRRR